ncbi:MAG: hypothetical protein CM15mP36_01730 [Flavobacteriales bacterium]|nr:MAG: hypothetical protein CM15mP36_01730 [Flavobacteriales bacterium]
MVVFEIQGEVRTISGVSNHSVQNVGDDYAVTATLSGALSSGQGVYLRYSNDSFNTSTIIEMSGSGTSYSASIPANFNIDGASISYYVFTSGDGLTISHENVDLYTINNLNNSGSNYSYSVATNYALNTGSFDPGDTWDSHVDGSYLYLANSTEGISIVDISDKTNPTEVGSLATTRAYDIFYLNNYLYVADYTSGMRIIDVSDKTNPTLISTIYSGTNTSLHYYSEINVAGNYAYIAAYKNFYIYDISDVNSPLVSTYSCGAGCNDFVIDGNYVYLANGFYGLQILDVSNPSSPTLTDSYDNGYLNGVSKTVIIFTEVIMVTF